MLPTALIFLLAISAIVVLSICLLAAKYYPKSQTLMPSTNDSSLDQNTPDDDQNHPIIVTSAFTNDFDPNVIGSEEWEYTQNDNTEHFINEEYPMYYSLENESNNRTQSKTISLATNTHTTQLWMFPSDSDGWKTIPLVPYESYHEYQILSEECIHNYCNMVEEVLTKLKKNSTLRPKSVSFYGFLWGVKSLWIDEGKMVFLKLTKGMGEEWCETVSVYFADVLDTATRVFIKHDIRFESISFETEFEEFQDEIFDFLRNEIAFHIQNRDNLNPFDIKYSFERVNFTFYSAIYSYHPTENNGGFKNCDKNYGMMPIGKFQDIVCAFAMGTHVRLGINSQLRILDNDILQTIFCYEIFHH